MDSAQVIREAREKSGLSKRELARRAGTSPAAIVKYESRQTSPTVDTMNRILRVAGWEVEVHLAPISQELVQRGEMMADLLSIVDLVEIRPADPYLKLPRFQDVVH
jgi:transcriptional regulator with XRE-family HTH domain